MPDAGHPEWFTRLVLDAAADIEFGTTDDPIGNTWREMKARGWESTRLVGGGRLPDGSLEKVVKIPTLVIPAMADSVRAVPVLPGASGRMLALVLLPVGCNESNMTMPPGSRVEYTSVMPDARIVGSAERLGRRVFEAEFATRRSGHAEPR